MELADLLNKTAEVLADYNGFTFKMQVFTEKLTPEYKAKLILIAAQAQAQPDGAERAEDATKDENALMLADLIESWRDKDDAPIVLKGEAFPPIYENLVKLSFPMLACLTRAITTYLGELANPQSATN